MLYLNAPHIRRLVKVLARPKKYNFRDLYFTKPSAGSCHVFVQLHAALWHFEFRMKAITQLYCPRGGYAVACIQILNCLFLNRVAVKTSYARTKSYL